MHGGLCYRMKCFQFGTVPDLINVTVAATTGTTIPANYFQSCHCNSFEDRAPMISTTDIRSSNELQIVAREISSLKCQSVVLIIFKLIRSNRNIWKMITLYDVFRRTISFTDPGRVQPWESIIWNILNSDQFLKLPNQNEISWRWKWPEGPDRSNRPVSQ